MTGSSRFFRTLAAVALLAGASACSEDSNTDPGGNGDIPVPTTYSFESRFEAGTSSVNYPGQISRNLLVQDLKLLVDGLAQPGATAVTVDDLKRYYVQDAGTLAIATSTGTLPAVQSTYDEISADKNLQGKAATEVVIGMGGATVDELMIGADGTSGWFGTIAANSLDGSKLGTPAVYHDANGVDLNQMINKVLLGAVPYYQATGVYLAGLSGDDNSTPRNPGAPDTEMEHHWDEAYGYFGAAHNYSSFSDADLAGSTDAHVDDANGDNRIDFESEYNYAFARNAGKRDLGATGVDLSGDTFAAFRAGRTAIVNQAPLGEILGHALAAAQGMEKIIAATVVHYINDTIADMNAIGTAGEDLVALRKHWGEMKGYTIALQFNPSKVVSDAQLAQLHGYMGDAPVETGPGTTTHDGAVADLLQARELFRTVYGFSTTNVENW